MTKIQLKRSNVLENGSAKEPLLSQTEYGELCVNYNEADPAIFIRDSSDQIVRLAGAGAVGNIEIPDTGADPHQPGTTDDRYVEVSGDNMTGNLTLGTDKITLDASDGTATFADGSIKFLGDGAFGNIVTDRVSAKETWLSPANSAYTALKVTNPDNNDESIKLYGNGSASFAGGETELNDNGGGYFNRKESTVWGEGSTLSINTRGTYSGVMGEAGEAIIKWQQYNADGSITETGGIRPDGSATFAGNVQVGPYDLDARLTVGPSSLSEAAVYAWEANAGYTGTLFKAQYNQTLAGSDAKLWQGMGVINGVFDTTSTIKPDGSAEFVGGVDSSDFFRVVNSDPTVDTSGSLISKGLFRAIRASGSGAGTNVFEGYLAGTLTSNIGMDGSASFANICKVSATDTSETQFYWNQTEHEGAATGPGYLTTARKGDVSLLVNYITVPDGTENTKLISRWVTDGGAAEGGKDIIDFHSDGSVSFAGDIEYGGTGYIAEGDLGELLGDGNPSNEYGTVIGVKPKASYSTARDFIVNLNPALSASREVFRIKGQDGSATFKGEIQASDVVVTNNGIVKSAIWNIAADNDNFLVAPGSIVSHVSTTTGASRAAFEVYYGASSNQTAAIFANGSAHFKGNVTSDGTIGFNLEPDNPDNYTSTTDSEGNETQVYNGPTLDVKERIQTKTTSLLAIKAACEDANITTVDGLKTAIAAALANI